jgi:hypothetical protein
MCAGQLFQHLGLLNGVRAAAVFSLYEREGFVSTKTEHFGYLRRILGYGAATTMVYELVDEP